MERDVRLQSALDKLSQAINEAVEQSGSVREAVENVRKLGFEPNLSMRLEIALEEIAKGPDEIPDDPELELTPDDIRALRRMQIAC
ncbi:MAG: hypothetical protein IPJ30_13540 [Acidobacteria bacterium]|nr:hypothetical protein [Acidobacteriota bacterium]